LGIQCHEKTVIEVTRAAYGNINVYIKDVTNKVEEFCKGKNSCDVNANNGVFGDPAPGAQKYLEVDYFCEIAEPRPVSLIEVQAGQKQFTSRLLQQIESTAESNFVLSPHSLHSVLAQLLQGAGGNTAAQLEEVLGVAASRNLLEQYNNLVSGLSGGGYKEANLLAVAQGFKPKNTFRSDLQYGFRSDIQEHNFGQDPKGSVQLINQFVENATNEKIKDLLDDSDVDGLTKLVLVNAVYFKANWRFSFSPDDTFNNSFNSPSGPVPVQYMTLPGAEVRILKDRERRLDILELPYGDPDKAMLIILPEPGVSSDNLVARLGELNLSSIRTEGRLAETQITIPKFKLKFKTYMKSEMQDMGVRDLFSSTANLSGIADLPLYATEAVHQAFIEVNEEGTEAAAATAAIVGLRLAQQKRRFFADRPFLFVVYDFAQDVALFAGKVVDPSTEKVVQRRASLVAEEEVVVRGDPAQCGPLLRDFPNSLDNSRICQKVASEGRKLEWLRQNRVLCEESKDFFDNFVSKSCGNLWCLEAAPKMAEWTADADSSLCQGVEQRVETPATKKRCKTAENNLKAANFLQCNN
jgi:serpin B